jgi:imidazolonepropionase-like amidohydrolase
MPLEMAIMEEAGFTTAEVLRMTTANNAVILKMDDRIGTVTKGKIADLAVYAKNPLETVRNMDHPVMVLQGGAVKYRTA